MHSSRRADTRIAVWPRRALYCAALVAVTCCGTAHAAPVIQNLSLRGLQAGAATIITIDGSELAPGATLLLPVPIASQTVAPDSTATKATFVVTLDAAVPAGIYPLRIAGPTGVSNTVLVGIDSLPQVPFATELAALPVALHGNLAGGTILRTSFVGKKGQSLVADVEARRLGSKLNPMLHVYDSRGVQLAWSQSTSSIAGDARARIELPSDGQYVVELHDALHQGAAPGHFRLKIGELHFADMVFPLAVQRGTQAQLELVGGNIPADKRAAASGQVAGHEGLAAWPAMAGCTAARPAFLVSDATEYVESSTVGAPQTTPAVPVGINGRIAAAKEEDVYRLPVTPGMQLRFDVLASRVGSPLDGVLSVRNEQGAELASSDDRPGMVDPGLDFTVPAGVNLLLVAMRDLVGRGGNDYLYRIGVTPVAQAGYRLTATTDRLLIPRGGVALLRVGVERSGFNGPIKLQFGQLPPGVTIAGDVVAPGMQQALVSLAATDAPLGNLVAGLTSTSADPQTPLAGPVQVSGPDVAALPRGLREQVVVAVVNPGPLKVTWSGVSAGSNLVAGTKLPAQVRITRAEGSDGAVRLSLLTSQIAPERTVRKDNKPVQEIIVVQTLRFEGTPTIAAGASEMVATLLVPVDLPPAPYDLSVRAELLSADGKTTLAEAVSPVARVTSTVAPPSTPLTVFEDQPEFVSALTEGNGQAMLVTDDKYSGAASIKATPEHRSGATIPGLGVKIREFPGPGEYRYLRFAWKKQGGTIICVQLNHDGKWGPEPNLPAKFRYHSGKGPEPLGGSLLVDGNPPFAWTVVTRDLFLDFGEFTLNGLGLAAIEAEYGLFDHFYLGRTPADFDALKTP